MHMHISSTSTCMNFLSQFYFWPHRSKGNFGRFLKANKKGPISPKPERPCPPKLVWMHFTSPFICMNFLSWFYFLTPWTIVHASKGKFSQIWKEAISLKLERPCPPNLVWMHFTSPSTCMNFLNQFWWEILAVLKANKKGGKISKNGEAMPTKLGTHAFHINLYLHFFKASSIFWPPWTTVHGLKVNFGHFEGKQKGTKFPKPERPCPSNLVCRYTLWSSWLVEH